MSPLITVVTVLRHADLVRLNIVANQVRYIALAAGGFDRVQWLISVDDHAIRPEHVLVFLSDCPVRHEVWFNSTGKNGDEAARKNVEGYSAGKFVVYLDGDIAVDTDGIAFEALAAEAEELGAPEGPTASA